MKHSSSWISDFWISDFGYHTPDIQSQAAFKPGGIRGYADVLSVQADTYSENKTG